MFRNFVLYLRSWRVFSRQRQPLGLPVTVVRRRRRLTHASDHRSRSRVRVAYEGLEERAVLAPVPIVAISDPGAAMIGQDLELTVSFDNQASGAPTVGYGPYVDLFLDTTGADGVFPGLAEPTDFDGLGPITAGYLGVSLTVTPVPLGPGGSFVHPFALDGTGDPLAGTAPAGFVEGDTLYVIELPFGSFVDSQPVANLAISSSLHPEARPGQQPLDRRRGRFSLWSGSA